MNLIHSCTHLKVFIILGKNNKFLHPADVVRSWKIKRERQLLANITSTWDRQKKRKEKSNQDITSKDHDHVLREHSSVWL
jgi:hypothetical protein